MDHRELSVNPGMPPTAGKVIHRAFLVGVALKLANGFFEIVGGVAILFVAPASWSQLAKIITRAEILEDPHDFFATQLLQFTAHVTGTAVLFGSLYLLSHGLIKAGLVFGMLKKRLWAYPAAMIIFSLFIISQLYYYMYKPSRIVLVLTVVDVFIVWLTYLEYRRLQGHQLAGV